MKKYKTKKDNNENIDIYQYGKYQMGLTDNEIKEYLKKEYNHKAEVMGVEKRRKCTKVMWNRFCQIAGVNTGIVVICEHCKKSTYLMYRHDVKRFADKMFLGTPTYFD